MTTPVRVAVTSEPTFSSADATLKTSSTTEPTARRAALEEWTSFQIVSLSTCKKEKKKKRAT